MMINEYLSRRVQVTGLLSLDFCVVANAYKVYSGYWAMIYAEFYIFSVEFHIQKKHVVKIR